MRAGLQARCRPHQCEDLEGDTQCAIGPEQVSLLKSLTALVVMRFEERVRDPFHRIQTG